MKGYLDKQTSEQHRRAQWPKSCDNNKDQDTNPIVNDVSNNNTSSQKFRQKLLHCSSKVKL